jgi:putative membrane protein
MKLIARLLLTVLTLLVVAEYVPGIEVDGFAAALVAAVVLGLLNIFIKPVLILLTLPFNILTLGMFTFVINALLFWFAANTIEGFAVATFWHALLGSLIVTVVGTVGSKYL